MTIDIPAQEPTPGSQERFIAELQRINAETKKFIAEHDKLGAETKKLRYDPVISAMTAGVALLGAGAAIGALLVKFH
jgi:hypothetical protein